MCIFGQWLDCKMVRLDIFTLYQTDNISKCTFNLDFYMLNFLTHLIK